MTTIYLIRHTQAEGNLYRVMQGSWDGDITPLGLKQIGKLRQRMEDVPIDKVYSSDLYRAYITAKVGVTDSRGLEVQKDEGLREICMGEWERVPFGNIIREHPEEARKFMFDSEHFHWPGTETFDEVRQRMYETIERIAIENDGKTIAIVSHGVALRCFLSKVLNVDLSDVSAVPICKNTAITKLEYDNGEFRIVYKNDYAHLQECDPPKWNSTSDLRDVPLNPFSDGGYYLDCYREGWTFAHEGTEEGFTPDAFLDAAKEDFLMDRGSVMKLMDKDQEAGLVHLAPDRNREENSGWISLLYLKPEYRGKGYGIQALGRAILTYLELGRDSVRLRVSRKNKAALAFYRKNGFEVIKDEGDTVVMSRPLNRKLV